MHHRWNFWTEFKRFWIFSHEPSMWPSPSMCISTTEIAFFGFPSTWLCSVCMLLAVITDTPWCISNMLYLTAGDWTHLLLCVLPNLSRPCARMRAYGLLDRCLDKHRELEKVFTFPKRWQGLNARRIRLKWWQKAGRDRGRRRWSGRDWRQTDGMGGAEVF